MKIEKTVVCSDCGKIVKEVKGVKSPFSIPKKVVECCNCGFKRVIG